MNRKGYALIAEPDARLSQVLVRIVSALGLEPVTTRDGAVARATLAERGAPAILITNLVLPRLDGFALLEALRSIVPPHAAAALVLSGSMEMRATAYNLRDRLGITEIVSSTMSPDSLRSAIRRALAAPTGAPSVPSTPVSVQAAPHWRPGRLARIASMGVLDDGPADEPLQRLVEETARAFDVPIALVSIVLEDRQWFKAHVGLEGALEEQRGTPLAEALCRHVVEAEVIAPLIVPDAAAHPLFADNPLVRAGKLGSYAGAPLLTAGGDVLGTLCIIDTKPRALDQTQIDLLIALARRVAGEIELTARARAEAAIAAALSLKLAKERSRTRAIASMVSSYETVLASLEIGILLTDADWQILYANPALAEMVGLSHADLVGLSGLDFARHVVSLSDNPEGQYLRLRTLPGGPFLASEEMEIARPLRRVLRWQAKPVELLSGIAQLEVFTDVTQAVMFALPDEEA